MKSALTANGQEPMVEGAIDASLSARARTVIEPARFGSPESLRAMVEREFALLSVRLAWRHVRCFRQSLPVPYQRLGGSGH
jgi:hypothetical protein